MIQGERSSRSGVKAFCVHVIDFVDVVERVPERAQVSAR